jgi:formate-dependent nitrite reductase membrane component NrfD
MNLYVADPDWRWWIVAYFFLGGIAAGVYFTATFLDLAAGARGRRLAGLGYLLAFPLVLVCAALLILDLGRPERFWHMVLKSEVAREAIEDGWPTSAAGWHKMWQAPLLKPWSPMSAGALGLAVFGLCSALSLAASYRSESKLLGWLDQGPCARLLQLVGCTAGFFLAAYTGSLLSATNQPLWSDTTWIAPLFLTSAASTGIAALLLLGGTWADEEMHAQLEQADQWVLLLEVVVFAAFVHSLQDWLGPIWATGAGKLLLVATPALAMALPLVLYWLRGNRPRSATRLVVVLAALAALGGGLLLRYSLLFIPPELLARGPSLLATTPLELMGTPARFPEGEILTSPEDGRAGGSGPGADPLNRPVTVRSKIPAAKAGE